MKIDSMDMYTNTNNNNNNNNNSSSGNNNNNFCPNKCPKFEPNVFNKNKCQACFKGKDEHSLQALEHNKMARKISMCDYFFVAPSSFDFDNPMDRTRRWQRRLFVLYDDGELTYSIDENVDTVPQGSIHVPSALEIADAEQITSHRFSIVIASQDGTRTYVKGASKEETERLKNKLKSVLECSKPTKVKRNFTISHSPSSARERKLEQTGSVSTSAASRNHFLSHPSLSVPAKTGRSRVLSEISNVGLPSTAAVFRNEVDIVDSASESPAERPSTEPRTPTYRNLRRLKNKMQDKMAAGYSASSSSSFSSAAVAGSNLRKSLSLQTLSDGTSTDLDGDILEANAPIRNVKDLLDQSMSRSSSLRSITAAAVDGSTNVDSWNDKTKYALLPKFTSGPSSAPRSPCLPSCTWPYSNTASPASSIEDRKDNGLSDFEDNQQQHQHNQQQQQQQQQQRRHQQLSSNMKENDGQLKDIKQKLEETNNDLLNKQNIISVVVAEISKMISSQDHHHHHHHQTRALNSRTSRDSLAEVQELLRTLNEFVEQTNAEKMELESALIRAHVENNNNNNSSSNNNNMAEVLRDLRMGNNYLTTTVEHLKADLEESLEKIRASDSMNESLERQLQQMKLSLKSSEIKRGMLERRNSEMMEEVAAAAVVAAAAAAVTSTGDQWKKSEASVEDGSGFLACSSCSQLRSERDVLIGKLESIQRTAGVLERDLADEKLCRESSRKSFLKELSDQKSKSDEDRQTIGRLQEELERLKEARTELTASANDRAAKVTLLSGDLVKVESELREAMNQNDQLNALYRESEQQVRDLTTGLESQSKRIVALEAEAKELSAERESLMARLEFGEEEKSCLARELERVLGQVESLTAERDHLLGEVERLGSNQPLGSPELLDELKEYAENLERKMAGRQKLQEEERADSRKKVLQLECRAGELEELLEAAEKEKAALIGSAARLEGEVKSLSRANEELEGMLHEAEKRSAESKAKAEKRGHDETDHGKVAIAAELEKSNSALKQRLRKMEVELEDARSSSAVRVQELSKKLDLEQRRCSRFCDSLRKLGSGGEESEEMVDHLECLVSELEKTRMQLQEAEERVELLRKDLEETKAPVKVAKVERDVPDGGEVSRSREETEYKSHRSPEELEARIRELELQLRNTQDDHQHELSVQRAAHRRELTTSCEETRRKLADAEANSLPINEDSIRKKYSKDVNELKELYKKGFHSLKKSQQHAIAELKRSHALELDRLRQEKEQLLNEEVAATQAALDAMKKAQEAELDRERQKFLDKLSQTYSLADMKALQKKHQEDVRFIEVEIRQLSEQYSIKCLENASLNERLKQQTTLLHENRKRVQDLLARNEELISHMKYEMEKLHRILGTLSLDKINPRGAIVDIKEAFLMAKQNEIFHLREQLKNANLRLDSTLEELRDFKEKYNTLSEKVEAMRMSSNFSSLDNSTNDPDVFRQPEDLDPTMTSSACSDWSVSEPFPSGKEAPSRGSSRKLTWKFKGGKAGKDGLNARLILAKCKSVDSDHSIASVGIPDDFDRRRCVDAAAADLESGRIPTRDDDDEKEEEEEEEEEEEDDDEEGEEEGDYSEDDSGNPERFRFSMDNNNNNNNSRDVKKTSTDIISAATGV